MLVDCRLEFAVKLMSEYFKVWHIRIITSLRRIANQDTRNTVTLPCGKFLHQVHLR